MSVLLAAMAERARKVRAKTRSYACPVCGCSLPNNGGPAVCMNCGWEEE